jgi:hypothetical protein
MAYKIKNKERTFREKFSKKEFAFRVVEGHDIFYPADKTYGDVGFVRGTKSADVKAGDELISIYKDKNNFHVGKYKIIRRRESPKGFEAEINGRQAFIHDFEMDMFEQYKKVDK